MAQLHIKGDIHIQEGVRVPKLRRHTTTGHPLPTKMDREGHSSRQEAHAQALERYHGQKDGVLYVHIAGPSTRGWYTAAAVTHNRTQVDGLLFR